VERRRYIEGEKSPKGSLLPKKGGYGGGKKKKKKKKKEEMFP